MKLPAQSCTTWITLVACFLVAFLPAGGLVFCIGPDGHLQVGTPSHLVDVQTPTCPCKSPDLASPADDLQRGDDDNHPPCRDLRVENPLLFSQNSCVSLDLGHPWDSGDQLPPVSMLSTAPAPDAPERSVQSPSQFGPLPTPTLRHRRTIVLLI